NNKEQKVAKFILENPKDIIHDSITELANNSHVSDTTVFRLCQKLGYKGYQDLKINLALAVIEPIKNINEEINESDDMYIIMHKLLQQNLHNLEHTVKINKSSELENAVNLLLKADQLLFFGMAGSGALAIDACHKFAKTGIRCIAHTDSHWQVIAASLVKENDVIIAFSNSGSNKEIIESLKLARKNKAKIITITGNAISPIAKVSDVVLVSYAKGDMFRSEATGSRITALLLTDCLTLAVSLRRKDETLKAIMKIREGIALTRY
ncbi:MAG: transcriptional regulator, RpiR family, partial [Anaerosporomusa subterranea]|nr:transcriptional regulator, RpiR family [Anaerosporomusa subterranea]